MKTLPHNIEAEQALLGAVLVNNAAYDLCEGLESGDFHEPIHRQIWSLITDARRNSRAVNPITLKGHFGADKIGDMPVFQYLIRLAGEAVTITGAADLARVVIETSCARRIICSMGEVEDVIRAWGSDLSIPREIDHLSGQMDIVRDRLAGEIKSGASTAYADALNRTMATAGGEVPFPFPEMAAVIQASGFEAGNLYGLLAASGEGKTSLTLNIIRTALRNDHPVLFLSFDQSEVQTVQQMVQQEHGVPMRLQRDHRRDKPALTPQQEELCWTFNGWLEARPWTFVKCDGSETGVKLAQMMRRWRKRLGRGCKTPLVVVDHVSAVMPEDRRAHEGAQVQSVTRPLKNMAGQAEAAVLVLYQRNTKSGDRPNPAPILTDVNGGQPAIRDLDALFTLYRPWRFMGKVDTSEMNERELKQFTRVFSKRNGTDRTLFTESDAQLAMLKNRFGRDDIWREIEFVGDRTSFKSTQSSIIMQERFA